MSVAGDILKQAIERSHQVHADHAAACGKAADALNERIKRPWQTRVESIGQAVATVQALVAGENHEDTKGSEPEA